MKTTKCISFAGAIGAIWGALFIASACTSQADNGDSTTEPENFGSDSETNPEEDAGTDTDAEHGDGGIEIEDSDSEDSDHEDSDTAADLPETLPLCKKVRAAATTDVCATDDAVFTAGYTPWVEEDTVITIGNGDAARTLSLGPGDAAKRFVSKTSADGETLWSVLFENGPEGTSKVNIDDIYPSGGGLFATGYARENSVVIVDHRERTELTFDDAVYLIFRFTEEGALDWVRRVDAYLHESTPVGDGDLLTLYEVYENAEFETAGKPWVVGNETKIFALVRYDAEGNIVFARRIETGSSARVEFLSDNSALVLGSDDAPVLFETDAEPVSVTPIVEGENSFLIARYDENGDLIFARSVMGPVRVETATVVGDQIFIGGTQTETASVAGEEGTVDVPLPEDSLNAEILARYSLSGEFIGVAQTATSGQRCQTQTYKGTDDGFDMVLVCDNQYSNADAVTLGIGDAARTFELPARQVRVFAARYDDDGELLEADELLHFDTDNFFYYENPVRAVFTEAVLAILVDIEAPVVFGDAQDETLESPNNLFDTRIAVYDESFERTAVHRSRTVREWITGEDDVMYVAAQNDKGFFRFDDRLSVDETAYVVRFEGDGGVDWISAVGVQPKQIVETKSDIVAVTDDGLGPMNLGDADTGVVLETTLGSRRSYLARFDKITGDLKSYGLLLDSDVGECSLSGLTECTDSILDIEAAAAYRDSRPPEILNELVWQEAARAVDSECLSLCAPDDDCTIQASCGSNGAEISLSMSESLSQSVYEKSYQIHRSAHILREDDGAPWSEVSYEGSLGESDMLDGPANRFSGGESSWSGLLIEQLPEDGAFSASIVRNTSPGDIYDGLSTYDLVAGTCDIAWYHEFVMNYTERENVSVNGSTYELVRSDDEWETLYLYINDTCSAQVDEETWEILGPCEG